MDKEEQGYWDHALMVNKLTDEIERLRLREETLSGIIDGMTARFIEAQGAVEEIERLREALRLERQLKDDALCAFNEARSALQQKESE